MKRLLYITIFWVFTFTSVAQIKAIKKEAVPFEAKQLFGIDNFETLYYASDDGTFHKKTKDTIVTYTNFQLGEITTANAFNPLKINLFYKDFNTVVILDNRLAEVFKIDFNTTQPYKNVSFVSTGADNTLWIFNQDFQQLELFDYKSNKVRLRTVPIQSKILDLKSDYNFCFLLTEDYLYIYNYFGSLLRKFENTGYESLAFSKANLVLKKEQALFLLQKNAAEILPIEESPMLINQFLVTDETLYIYHNKMLQSYQLKIF